MTAFLRQHYGPVEGPLGFPLLDQQARALDERLRALPRDAAYEYRRAALGRGLPDLEPGERSDVSWISEETPDRFGDVVLASGMDDSQFALNPLVTLNHSYWQPPVGRSLWRRQVSEGGLRGIRARTHYPARPASWPRAEWPPDFAYELVKAGLLHGKSIGFLPVKVRTPTDEERRQRPELLRVRFIIEEWLLLEYACCYLPAQPHAVVEQVSKALPPAPVAFTPLEEYEQAVARRVAGIDFAAAARRAIDDHLQRALGRV